MDTKSAIYSLVAAVTIFLSSAGSDNITFSPTSATIQENYNGLQDLSNVSAKCTAQQPESYSCSHSTFSYNCGPNDDDTCYRTRYSVCYKLVPVTVDCNSCNITLDNSNHFTMSGSLIQKKRCVDTYCKSCTTPGCLNGGSTHQITVTCRSNGYHNEGSISGTFSVNVTNAAAPTFEYRDGNSIDVYHNTTRVGDVINKLNPLQVKDDDHDVDKAYYRQNSGPEVSYKYNTSDLFKLDTETGEVKVNEDLTLEYSYTFTMNLCVYDRRGREDCKDLKIKLWACFQIPNCEDQNKLDLHDTYGTYTKGHGGDSNTLFKMIYEPPSGHFTNFSAVWHNLSWTFASNELPEADINVNTGEIYITKNISIWPAWPTKDFKQKVVVSNSESCSTSTCSFDIRVHYTNWPIEICITPKTSLPENQDSETLLFNITTCDYNYASEDNVTCDMTDWTPKEDNLFDLRHDENHAFDSYKLYKLECSTHNCGYKYEEPTPYYCNTSTGCLTHNRTQQYTITIQCKDGYNSSDTIDLTFDVVKNEAPVYIHLPTHIDLNRQKVSHLDRIFEIIYSDNENDELKFEYVYTDVETNLSTTFFHGDSRGNTHNNMANITMTTSLADKEVNKTYKIQICGHERRNERCTELTIDIEEYCSDSPQCSDRSFSTDTEFAIGDELFDISSLVSDGSFTDLSYDITSQHGSLFSVDSITGKVTTTAKFEEIFDSATYSIIAFVNNEGSCWYAQCQLTVNVTAINYAVEITNLPATVSVLEDLAADETVFKINVDDDNENDPYTCDIVNTNSVEPFYLERNPPVSGEYFIKNQAEGVLSSATTTYSVSIECTDSHGGSDTEVLTITVTLNQAPVFTSFTPNSTQEISADPMNFKIGDTLYTVAATDNEGDDLTFTCTISNSQVPFECESEAEAVNLKVNRDLRIDDDNGQTYSAQVCLRDKKHSDRCENLEVTFTRVKTRPEITNLPDTISFTEDTAEGTSLFEAIISDPDIGESYDCSMAVKPASESSMFNLITLNKSGILTLVKPLDYERTKNYLLTYTVKDDYLDCLTDKTLKIDVLNVNEGTTINASPTSISFYEDMTAGEELTGPDFSCSDTEGDATSYEILSGNHKDYFSVSSDSGRITLVNEWDLESPDALPTSTILTISCKDSGGLSSTVDIVINIEDANDKTPKLNVLTGSSPISVNSSTCLCSDLMSFAASDSDYSDDGDFEFSILGSGIGFEYFRMLKTRQTTATLKLKEKLPFKNDKTFSISIMVCDGESPPLCDAITVEINFTVGDPDDFKAKERARCLTCTGIGRTLVAVTCIEGVFVVGFVLHILVSFYLTKNVKVENILKSRKTRSTNARQGVRSNNKGISNNARTRFTRSNAIEMNKMENNKNKSKEEETSSGSSSLSSDSDDDGGIRRSNIQRYRLSSTHKGQGLEATEPEGLPSPFYTNRLTSAGQRSMLSVGDIESGFYV